MSTEVLSGIGSAVAGVAESVSAPVASVGAVAESAGSVVQSAGSLADVGGNLANFGNDMHMPSLNKGLFSNTKVFSQFDPPVSDRLFPSNLLKGTVVLAKSEPLNSIPESVIDLKPGLKIEEPVTGQNSDIEALEDQASELVELPQTVNEVLGKPDIQTDIEDKVKEAAEIVVFKAPIAEEVVEGDGFALEAVSKELKLAEKVNDLLLEVNVEPQKANELTQKALTTALERKGLASPEPEIEPEPELETQAEPLQAKNKLSRKSEVKTGQKKKEEDTTEKEEEKQDKSKRQTSEKKPEFVRDEYADEARRQDARQALEKIFNRESGKPGSGEDLVENMHQKPNTDEMSELALSLKQDNDGSYQEILKELRGIEFDSKEDAKRKVEKLIKEKPAVKLGKGNSVGKDDVKRVLKSFKSFSDPWFSHVSRGLFGR